MRPSGSAGPDVVVTGISRSGTSYLCNLLHRFENCVAINEPGELVSLLRNEKVPWGVPAFYREVRWNVLAGTPIENKLHRGEVVEDTALNQRRQTYTPSVRSADFVLAMKNTREFLLRLDAVRHVMPAARVVACIRDPFDTVASWKASFPHLRSANVRPFLRHRRTMWLPRDERAALKRILATADDAERRARWWSFQAERILARRDAVLLVDYEELVSAPMTVLARLLDGYGAGALRRPITSSVARSRRTLLDEADVDAIRAICGPVAVELGLAPPNRSERAG